MIQHPDSTPDTSTTTMTHRVQGQAPQNADSLMPVSEESTSRHDSNGHDANENSRIQIGRYYKCVKEEMEHVAEVIGKRNDSYYVHYVAVDRRLDEWLPGERLGEEVSSLEVHGMSTKSGGRGRKRTISNITDTNGNGEEDGSNRSNRLWSHGHGHDEHTKVRNIHSVQFGKYDIECWYYSPFPNEYSQCDKLYICEKTFKYMKSEKNYIKHLQDETVLSHPPGIEIYNDPNKSLIVYQVDGAVERLYCQNLCLFGKLFIEHKTLYYDPNPFYFYIIVEKDNFGLHPVGYFSKEKDSPEGYNLACILTLPPYQRKGYGKFIISLSYELSKIEHKLGSPEKPLSDLGKLSYRSFWSCQILSYLKNCLVDSENDDAFRDLKLQKLADDTGIKTEDIMSTLQSLKLVKVFKGQYVLAISKSIVLKQLQPYINRRYTDYFCKLKYINANALKK